MSYKYFTSLYIYAYMYIFFLYTVSLYIHIFFLHSTLHFCNLHFHINSLRLSIYIHIYFFSLHGFIIYTYIFTWFQVQYISPFHITYTNINEQWQQQIPTKTLKWFSLIFVQSASRDMSYDGPWHHLIFLRIALTYTRVKSCHVLDIYCTGNTWQLHYSFQTNIYWIL